MRRLPRPKSQSLKRFADDRGRLIEDLIWGIRLFQSGISSYVLLEPARLEGVMMVRFAICRLFAAVLALGGVIGCNPGAGSGGNSRTVDRFIVQENASPNPGGETPAAAESTPAESSVPAQQASPTAGGSGGAAEPPTQGTASSGPASPVQGANTQAVGGLNVPISNPMTATPPAAPVTQPADASPETIPTGTTASAPTDQVVDLLAMVVPERDSRNGVWQREGNALVSPPQALTVLTFPHRVQGRYRVTITAERIQGNEALNLVVPYFGRPAMFVLEGFGKKVIGLNLIEGRTADQHPSSVRGDVFVSGRATEIACSVHGFGLTLSCDGSRIRWSWSGSPAVVRIDSRFWTDIPGDRISLAVYSAETRFRVSRAVLEPLSSDEIAASRMPPPQRAPGFFDERSWPGGFGGPPPANASPGSPGGPDRGSVPRPGEQSGAAEDFPPPRFAPAEPAPEEAQRRKESVCLVESPLISGSGFVLGENIIATNAHVTAEAFVDEIKLVFGSQRSQTFRPKRILYEDGLRDICLMEADVAAPPIPFLPDYELQKGDKVVVIGNPSLGETGFVLRDAVTTGRISALVHTGGCDFYQIHAEISPGSSGGPVLNWAGEVIGIIAMKATAKGEDEIRKAMMRLDRSVVAQAGFSTGRGIAFAVPAPVVAEALTHARSPNPTELQKIADWHDARVILRRSAALWAIHFLKFCANVPSAVREQEMNIRLRRLPAATLRQIKQVDLMPPTEAWALLSVLEGPEVSRMVRACSNQLDERFEALRGSSHLPQDALKSLDELRRAVTRAKGLAENPPNNYQYYAKAFYDQKDSVKQLVERLAEQLQVEEAGYGD